MHAWTGRGCGRALIAGLMLGLAPWPTSAAGVTEPSSAPRRERQQAAPLTMVGEIETSSVVPVSQAGSVREEGGPEAKASGAVVEAKTLEWIVGVGVAKSVEVFHSRGGIRYGVQTLSWTRELTSDHGPGLLRGRLGWVVEVMPVLAESSPARVYGVGIAPIAVRWSFQPRRRWSAFTELAGGFLGSSAAIPSGAARFNITAHGGVGVRLPVLPGQGAVVAYRFQHISNGDRLSNNPAVNSHMAFVGWSMTRRR